MKKEKATIKKERMFRWIEIMKRMVNDDLNHSKHSVQYLRNEGRLRMLVEMESFIRQEAG